ncbi:MAG TPA: MarR family transcriptional regulator [Actinocrinis sp.]
MDSSAVPEPQSLPRDDPRVRSFVENLALLFADWGFPRMPGRVLFALMTAEEPGLTATGLAERLEVSPAAISGAVRYLNQIGLTTREAVPGSRRDVYKLRDNAWYQAAFAKVSFYNVIETAADDAIGALGGELTASGARVAEMREFFAFMREEADDMMKRWHERRQELWGPAGDPES